MCISNRGERGDEKTVCHREIMGDGGEKKKLKQTKANHLMMR